MSSEPTIQQQLAAFVLNWSDWAIGEKLRVTSSPTQRTLEALRELGYTVAVAEIWDSYSGCRRDLFGFIDIVAVGNGQTIGVQCTTRGNVSSRRAKIVQNSAALAWLQAGNRIEIWGWKKYAKPVDGKWWRCYVEAVKPEQFAS